MKSAQLLELLQKIPGAPSVNSAKERVAVAFKSGSMLLEVYVPQFIDTQSTHDFDELYLVISGEGTFQSEGSSMAFSPGTAICVPAGVPHRFKDFSTDFATWVIFWGPRGGEAVAGDTL